MKKILLTSLLLISLGCNKTKEISSNELIFKEGKAYTNTTFFGEKLYTGKVFLTPVQTIDNISITTNESNYKDNAVIEVNNIGFNGFYKDGKKDGEWTYLLSNQKILRKGSYSSGYKTGEWIFNNSYGIEQYRIDYSLLGNNPKDYDKKATELKSKVLYLKNTDTKISGVVYYYNNYGKLESISGYKDGIKEGRETLLHENGEVKVVYNYINGKLNGSFKIKDSDGHLKSVGAYNHGNKDGEWTTYNIYNRKIDSQKFYVNGKRDGEWKEFYYEGQLKSHKIYKNDLKTGTWIYYYSDGSIYKSEIYENNLKHGKWQYFNEKNEVTFFYENDYLVGEWQFKDLVHRTESVYPITSKLKDVLYGDQNLYYKNNIYHLEKPNTNPDFFKPFSGIVFDTFTNGRIKIFEEYLNGKRNGQWVYFHDNGNISKIQFYSNGNLITDPLEFDRDGNPE